MTNPCKISATIVIYNQNLEILKKSINSFLNIPLKKNLYIIDNSSRINLKKFFLNKEITYIYLPKNVGFGAAHNHIINMLNSEYHLVLNPDIEFDPSIINLLINKLQKEKFTSFIVPKIVYPNLDIQFVCRRHPTILKLFKRKLGLSKLDYEEEYKGKPFYPDFIHGCFMLFKTYDFINLGGFDKRFFLYMEDADICKKIKVNNKRILYYPKVKAIHHHQKGSSKSLKLFLIHILSAFKYFLKWGFK
jgi:GT2 family glycosyltransferase